MLVSLQEGLLLLALAPVEHADGVGKHAFCVEDHEVFEKPARDRLPKKKSTRAFHLRVLWRGVRGDNPLTRAHTQCGTVDVDGVRGDHCRTGDAAAPLPHEPCHGSAAGHGPRLPRSAAAPLPHEPALGCLPRSLHRRPVPLGKRTEILPLHALPSRWDWRNPFGNTHSYVTAVRNQYLPRWCGSCWAQAVTSALSGLLSLSAERAAAPAQRPPRPCVPRVTCCIWQTP